MNEIVELEKLISTLEINNDKVNQLLEAIKKNYETEKFIKNSNDKGFRLLCGYDVMNFYFITDSTAVFDLGIFQGWKTPGKDFKDTIKITNLEEIIQLNKDENSAIIDFKSTTNLSTTIHLEIRYNPKNTDVLNAANGNVTIKEVNYTCKDLWYK